VLSLWRNPDGSWSAEQNLGNGVALCTIATVVLPGTEVLQIFYATFDGDVCTQWRDPDGSWSAVQNLGGRSVGFGSGSGGDVAAIVLPGTQIVQVLYGGWTGLRMIQRNPDGSWSAEQNLGGTLSFGSAVTPVRFPFE
jgi:hypothetical protein